MKRLVVAVTLAMTVVLPAVPAASGAAFPASIPLPDGFYPEGVAVGRGAELYAGSLLDGRLYKADLRSG
ncbi:MAG TPA: hypothetical protein VM263_08355, partial [Acidimicrobiales bacterium]|nr:hypothetical protein [Acidimicrobiales bacterium]